MVKNDSVLGGRLLVVALEGWNDAGEAASGAVRTLKDQLGVVPVAEIDGEYYFDYQFNRPTIATNDDGTRSLDWPSVIVYGPASDRPAQREPIVDEAGLSVSGDNAGNVFILLGTEPSRSWKSFAEDLIAIIDENDIEAVITLGAMLADVPHTRPISVFTSSENPEVRAELGIERSLYEGPVGMLTVITDAAEAAGVPTVSVWASVPHYVHNTPSPKAMLALIDRLEELIDVVIPRGELLDEAQVWERSIDQLTSEDEDMASYIHQLEQARDTVDSPEASGEAIAQEFERYLRRRGGEGKPPPGPTAS
ncbi:PAC2 family protein [Cryobacterium sp. BB307]|uniref:PAC2 family protein n=1 Tax=Cryobacterium sp. BB307 TaxID=2716317 RepID=UPI001445672E